MTSPGNDRTAEPRTADLFGSGGEMGIASAPSTGR
jgi:hypothetical protein